MQCKEQRNDEETTEFPTGLNMEEDGSHREKINELIELEEEQGMSDNFAVQRGSNKENEHNQSNASTCSSSESSNESSSDSFGEGNQYNSAVSSKKALSP